MISGRLSTLARLTFGNRASQVYLGLVLMTAAFLSYDLAFTHHPDATFAGVPLLLLAVPTVLGFLAAGGVFGDAVTESAAFLYPALVLSVLIQSAALGALVRLLRRPGQPARTETA
ncbi:SCO4225 family membrane protein [Streptomyces paludis]|uniref:Uncharacterized protein n=1 Tax=Streptomyces paludis TaxID=2282738 RepID=A0A345HIK1_9ACTN|nr:hypothetical protein [Streptomyces paludis]AXG76525.1 hypothetical protein DVK44_01275 [Streptomyces paludis]